MEKLVVILIAEEQLLCQYYSERVSQNIDFLAKIVRNIARNDEQIFIGLTMPMNLPKHRYENFKLRSFRCCSV